VSRIGERLAPFFYLALVSSRPHRSALSTYQYAGSNVYRHAHTDRRLLHAINRIATSRSRSQVGVLNSPLLGFGESTIDVLSVVIGNGFIKRIVKVVVGHQSLDGEENRSDLESGRPLVLEDIETDTSKLINVGVVDLCAEKNLRGAHRVLLG
jgi:hypothetical protein